MKYAEYQVWYHVYTVTVQSLCHNVQTASIQDRLLADDIILQANKIAAYAADLFSQVEDKPKVEERAMPNLNNLDVQGIVDKVIKDATKRK